MSLSDREAVIILLETRGDWHEGMSVQQLPQIAKPGVGGWARCERCATTGRVIGQGQAAKPCRGSHAGQWPYEHNCRPCLACEDGWIRVKEGSDRMLNPGQKGDLHSAAMAKEEVRLERIRENAALRRQLAEPKSDRDDIATTPPFVWERERDRYHRHGHYQELTLALEWLNDANPTARQLVAWAYEHHIIRLGTATAQVREAAEQCVDVLAQRMPRPVRVPVWLRPKHPALVRLAPKHGKAAA